MRLRRSSRQPSLPSTECVTAELCRTIAAGFDETVALLAGEVADAAYVESSGALLNRLAAAYTSIGDLAPVANGREIDPAEMLRRAREQAAAIAQTSALFRSAEREVPDLLTAINEQFTCAISQLAGLVPGLPAAETKKIIIPTDLLYQAHHALFPAERMLVAAGHREGTGVVLGATFDVTGESQIGHVRADPGRLGRALISMTLAGTFMASWLHSHPGEGKLATQPSGIDRRQQTDWLREFSPALLGVIVVEDRWIRLWGDAIETGHMEIEVRGPGVVEEDRDEHVYRLES